MAGCGILMLQLDAGYIFSFHCGLLSQQDTMVNLTLVILALNLKALVHYN